MVHEKLTLISRVNSETGDEGIGIAVGDLQAHAQQHREDEEERHTTLAEQAESIESQSLNEVFAFALRCRGAGGKGQRIGCQQQTPSGGDEKLDFGALPARQVHNPHGNDEPNRAEDADGRKGFDRVEPCAVESVVGNGVGQCERGHIGRYAEGVDRKESAETMVSQSGQHAYGNHRNRRDEMAEGEHALCRYPAVGHNADNGGHEDGHKSLYGVKPTDVSTHTDTCKESSHGNQVGTPNGKFEKIHRDESRFDEIVVHVVLVKIRVVK